MAYLYFDEDLNTVDLPVCASVLYSRSGSQTFDAPYWLLTPAAYATAYARVMEADKQWQLKMIPDALFADLAARWEVIDSYARRHLDPVQVDDAFRRMARLGRPLPLPKPPPRQDACSPW